MLRGGLPICSEDSRKAREDRFALNLIRICGITDAITPDIMLEICVYVQNENVIELLELEQSYLAYLFNDVSLDEVVCSVNYLIESYEKAKNDKDVVYLRKFRDAHRQARRCLDKPGLKETVQKLIKSHAAQRKKAMYFQALYPVLQYIEQHGTDDQIGAVLSRALPELVNEEIIQLIQGSSSSVIGNAK